MATKKNKPTHFTIRRWNQFKEKEKLGACRHNLRHIQIAHADQAEINNNKTSNWEICECAQALSLLMFCYFMRYKNAVDKHTRTHTHDFITATNIIGDKENDNNNNNNNHESNTLFLYPLLNYFHCVSPLVLTEVSRYFVGSRTFVTRFIPPFVCVFIQITLISFILAFCVRLPLSFFLCLSVPIYPAIFEFYHRFLFFLCVFFFFSFPAIAHCHIL